MTTTKYNKDYPCPYYDWKKDQSSNTNLQHRLQEILNLRLVRFNIVPFIRNLYMSMLNDSCNYT